jgi:hypothetical protein
MIILGRSLPKYFVKSLIIREENTKEIMSDEEFVYLIENLADLHKCSHQIDLIHKSWSRPLILGNGNKRGKIEKMFFFAVGYGSFLRKYYGSQSEKETFVLLS